MTNLGQGQGHEVKPGSVPGGKSSNGREFSRRYSYRYVVTRFRIFCCIVNQAIK